MHRELKGDLDWITLHALEKDRTRRYASASELAADVRRHQADEPVTAGPPSAWYRAREFVRKHRTAVGVAASFVILSAPYWRRTSSIGQVAICAYYADGV